MMKKSFWLALVLVSAGLVYAYAQYQSELNQERIYATHDSIVITSVSLARKFEQMLNTHLEHSELIITSSTLKELVPRIEQEIANAFTPIYAQIPKLADYHYSIIGSYSQFLANLTSQDNKEMMRILFDEAEYDKRLTTAFTNIAASSSHSLNNSLVKLDKQTKSDLNLRDEEVDLINNVLQLTQDNITQRFDLSLNTLRIGGISVAGAGIGIIAQRGTRMASRNIAARLATITAAKTAAKVASSSSSGKTGAVVGGAAGSIVPGVGTAVGAVVGGTAGAIVGWVGTEQAIVKVDEYLNRTEFEADIANMLDQIQTELKLSIYHHYEDILNDVGTARTNAFRSKITPKELIENSKSGV
jgi:uncharacterized protein YjeT (DUF2065 family)